MKHKTSTKGVQSAPLVYQYTQMTKNTREQRLGFCNRNTYVLQTYISPGVLGLSNTFRAPYTAYKF